MRPLTSLSRHCRRIKVITWQDIETDCCQWTQMKLITHKPYFIHILIWTTFAELHCFHLPIPRVFPSFCSFILSILPSVTGRPVPLFHRDGCRDLKIKADKKESRDQGNEAEMRAWFKGWNSSPTEDKCETDNLRVLFFPLMSVSLHQF